MLTPQLVVATLQPAPAAALSVDDHVLVTGGAKGIGAECALAIATRYGCAVTLVGRSDADDAEVRANLTRFAGLRDWPDG